MEEQERKQQSEEKPEETKETGLPETQRVSEQADKSPDKISEKETQRVSEQADKSPDKIPEKPEKIKKYNSIAHFFQKEYKRLLIFTLLILAIAIGMITFKYTTTGEFMNKDVSLKGGMSLTIPTQKEIDTNELGIYLKQQLQLDDISIRILKSAGTQIGIVIEADIDATDEVLVNKLLNEAGSKLDVELEEGSYSIEFIGSSLGRSFFREIFTAVLIAFLFMGLVVFIAFRVPVPSIAVILSAFSDIIITLAIVNLMGIRIGSAGIAAFLMLIGYSVDTDILLTNRLLKRKEGTINDRIKSAFKTGMMMSATTIAAITIALVFTESEVIKQIMTILIVGLFVDVMNTWIQNVGILRLYLARKNEHA